MQVTIPAVDQRRYCGTCHFPLGAVSYPERTVEVATRDEAAIPQQLAMVHVSACPNHNPVPVTGDRDREQG